VTVASTKKVERRILIQLSKVQAKRFATHPLFLTSVALSVLAMIGLYDDAPTSDGIFLQVIPAFLFGVLGLIVAYRLTRTEERALALLPSAPTPAAIRTLALCAACLVPAAAAAIWIAVSAIAWWINPPADHLVDAIPLLSLAAWLLGSTVVAAFGGSVLGVTVARWLRFPGAGVLAAIVLTLVTVIGVNLAYGDPEGLVGRVGGDAVPFTDWILSDPVALRPGSPIAHLMYQLGLVGLAIWAAVIRDADVDERRVWTRTGSVFALISVTGMLWALFG
jgi:hypothetical protein